MVAYFHCIIWQIQHYSYEHTSLCLLWLFFISTLTQNYRREMISLSCEPREEAQETRRLTEKINKGKRKKRTHYWQEVQETGWNSGFCGAQQQLARQSWLSEYPISISTDPKGLNQTGGYFKLSLQRAASARKCVIVRQSRKFSAWTLVGVKESFCNR